MRPPPSGALLLDGADERCTNGGVEGPFLRREKVGRRVRSQPGTRKRAPVRKRTGDGQRTEDLLQRSHQLCSFLDSARDRRQLRGTDPVETGFAPDGFWEQSRHDVAQEDVTGALSTVIVDRLGVGDHHYQVSPPGYLRIDDMGAFAEQTRYGIRQGSASPPADFSLEIRDALRMPWEQRRIFLQQLADPWLDDLHNRSFLYEQIVPRPALA